MSTDMISTQLEYLDFVPRQRFQSSGQSVALALSPDAGTVAYATNASGQFNLWAHPVAGGPARQLTHYTRNAVRNVAWTPDGRSLLIAVDRDGDEQYQLYLLDAARGDPARLTAADGRQHWFADRPFDRTGRYLIYSVNDRDVEVQDVLVRDLHDGHERRFVPPQGVVFEPVAISPDGRWLLISGFRSQTDIDCYLVDLADPEAKPQAVTATAGEGFCEPVSWAAGPGGFYVATNTWGGEFADVGYYTMADANIRKVISAGWDIESLAVAADSDTLAWTVNQAGSSIVHARRDGRDIPLPDMPAGVVSALRLSQDGSVAAVVLDAATRPAEVAIVDLDRSTFRYLTDSRPAGLRAVQPVEPATVDFPSIDGRTVSALLYRPHGDGPFPVLLSIHGGPHMQERPGYGRIGLYQYLLARGVAVFAPNMAGSTGYGTSFEKLIYRDWGGVDLEDLDAAMAYLQAVTWADVGRVAVMGGSYGGFATLSCLSRLDYQWAAGVSICGPSNLVTLARECPPTWRTFVDTVLGNPDADADQLTARSPVTYADRITAPLFVIQGAQDPRVPQAESDQIVDKLRGKGVEVRYDIYPDEGHGFTNRANEIKAYTDIAEFLLDHLGR